MQHERAQELNEGKITPELSSVRGKWTKGLDKRHIKIQAQENVRLVLTVYVERVSPSGNPKSVLGHVIRSKVSRGINMANEETTTALDSVQCPVCFRNFKPTTINGHLDVCLLKGGVDSGPSTADELAPPSKKPRVSAEAAPPTSPGVNKPLARTGTSTMFSLFQTNKSKVSLERQQKGSFTVNQSTVNTVGQCNGPNEAEPGQAAAAGTEALESQTSASKSGPTGKAAHGLSPRTLLAMNKPLAEILRPNNLEEYFGQTKVVGEQTLLRSLLDSQDIPSLILWGPPGCGKVRWCQSGQDHTVFWQIWL